MQLQSTGLSSAATPFHASDEDTCKVTNFCGDLESLRMLSLPVTAITRDCGSIRTSSRYRVIVKASRSRESPGSNATSKKKGRSAAQRFISGIWLFQFPSLRHDA